MLSVLSEAKITYNDRNVHGASYVGFCTMTDSRMKFVRVSIQLITFYYFWQLGDVVCLQMQV